MLFQGPSMHSDAPNLQIWGLPQKFWYNRWCFHNNKNLDYVQLQDYIFLSLSFSACKITFWGLIVEILTTYLSRHKQILCCTTKSFPQRFLDFGRIWRAQKKKVMPCQLLQTKLRLRGWGTRSTRSTVQGVNFHCQCREWRSATILHLFLWNCTFVSSWIV